MLTNEELTKILKENKETLKSLDGRMHRIEKKFIWNTIFGFLKFLVIWAPIIAGIIYFTPILRDYVKIFDPLVNTLRNKVDLPASSGGGDQDDFAVETFCDPQAREALVEQLCK